MTRTTITGLRLLLKTKTLSMTIADWWGFFGELPHTDTLLYDYTIYLFWDSRYEGCLYVGQSYAKIANLIRVQIVAGLRGYERSSALSQAIAAEWPRSGEWIVEMRRESGMMGKADLVDKLHPKYNNAPWGNGE